MVDSKNLKSSLAAFFVILHTQMKKHPVLLIDFDEDYPYSAYNTMPVEDGFFDPIKAGLPEYVDRTVVLAAMKELLDHIVISMITPHIELQTIVTILNNTIKQYQK